LAESDFLQEGLIHPQVDGDWLARPELVG